MTLARNTLLSVENLTVHFDTPRGTARAVEGVAIDLRPGETTALVGESGCGKTVTALSVLRLLPQPPARYVSGRVRLEGRDLLAAPDRQMRDVRGREIAMIFQEPMSALNPVLDIGIQVMEPALFHKTCSRRAARQRAADLLARVGISEPKRCMKEYPHQLSGGMRQRAMIAMALMCEPKVLIADEPTTALDVTIQAQILALLADLQAELGMSVLLITHDLGVVAHTARRVAVMYAGRIVERAGVTELFDSPRHPYTKGLLDSLPDADNAGQRLDPVQGQVPEAFAFPDGCRFWPRCPRVQPECRSESPPFFEVGDEHEVACWLYEGG